MNRHCFQPSLIKRISEAVKELKVDMKAVIKTNVKYFNFASGMIYSLLICLLEVFFGKNNVWKDGLLYENWIFTYLFRYLDCVLFFVFVFDIIIQEPG